MPLGASMDEGIGVVLAVAALRQIRKLANEQAGRARDAKRAIQQRLADVEEARWHLGQAPSFEIDYSFGHVENTTRECYVASAPVRPCRSRSLVHAAGAAHGSCTFDSWPESTGASTRPSPRGAGFP